MNTLIEKALLAEFPDEVAHVWSRVGTPEVATDAGAIEATDTFIALKPRAQWKRARTQAGLVEAMNVVVEDIRGGRNHYFTYEDGDVAMLIVESSGLGRPYVRSTPPMGGKRPPGACSPENPPVNRPAQAMAGGWPGGSAATAKFPIRAHAAGAAPLPGSWG